MRDKKTNNFKVTAIGEMLFDVYPNYKKIGGAPLNFIYHVEKLIGNGKIISRVGNDSEGKELLSFLTQNKITTDYIQLDTKNKTGKVNVVLNKDKIPSFDILPDRAYDFIELNNNVIMLIENSDLLYFGSLAQRNQVSREAIQSATKKSKKVFCDLNIRQEYYSKDIIHNSLLYSNIIKLNEDELMLVTKLIFDKNDDLQSSAKKILSKYKLDMLCITLGSEGAYLFCNDEVNLYKADINNIVDTVGAGDAYSAMMCIGYLNNWELDKINELASKFAGDICKINGAIPENNYLYQLYKEKIK